jgi:hypothetical protein
MQQPIMARLTGDFWDSWPELSGHFAYAAQLEQYSSPLFSPDLDMLPMGWIAHVGTGPRFSLLTEAEQRSMMTQWVIARMPLIWGGDPVRSNASTLALLTNQQVLDVQTESCRNVQLPTTGSNTSIVWVAQGKPADTRIVAVFNLADGAAKITLPLSAVGLAADTQVAVQDLWASKAVPVVGGAVHCALGPHASCLLKLRGGGLSSGSLSRSPAFKSDDHNTDGVHPLWHDFEWTAWWGDDNSSSSDDDAKVKTLAVETDDATTLQSLKADDELAMQSDLVHEGGYSSGGKPYEGAADHALPWMGQDCGTVPLSCKPNCATAIATAVTKCSSGGGGTVLLSAGIYVLNDTAIADGQMLIVLNNVHRVALVGAASSRDSSGRHTRSLASTPSTKAPGKSTTLMIYGLRGAFEVSNSSNVAFRFFEVDMVRQPYTYGKCVAVAKNAFSIEYDPGIYPFLSHNVVPAYLLQVRSVTGFDRTAWRMPHDGVDIYTTADPYPVILHGNNSTLTVHGSLSTNTNFNHNRIKVGGYYILRHHVYGLGGFTIDRVVNVELTEINLYSAAGMGFLFERSSNVHLKNCGVRRRPGRPMSITADASHFSECNGTVHLDGVHFEGQGDDGVNVHGRFYDVQAVEMPGNFHAVGTGGSSNASRSGSRFELGGSPAAHGQTTPPDVGGRYQFRSATASANHPSECRWL